jgi:predicted small lipoprotein YifL
VTIANRCDSRGTRRTIATVMAGALLSSLAGCGKSPALGEPAIAIQSEVEASPARREEPKSEAGSSEKSAALPSGTAFTFPADNGGKLLAKLLPPSDLRPLSPAAPEGPRARPIPTAIEWPSAALSPGKPVPPRLPLPKTADIHPRALPEPLPADFARLDPTPPARIRLPEGELTRLPAPNASRPLPLPPLAQPVSDRASLEDPTADYSARAVIGAALRPRTTPVPFLKVNLPDPFENAEMVRLRVTMPEDANRSLGTPPAPKRELK